MRGFGTGRSRTFLLTLIACFAVAIESNELHAPSKAGFESAPGAEAAGPGVPHGLEHGEAGEHEFSRADFQVSCMLLGGVSFVMWLFFLVNYRDEDIRRYSWYIISMTISIFLAVLLFQAINEIVVRIVERFGEAVACLVQFVQCFVYIAILQYGIAGVSGALTEAMGNFQPVNLDREDWVISDPMRIDHGMPVREELVRNGKASRGVTVDQFGMEVPVQKVKVELQKRDLSMKSSARLLAHMAGFAAINVGGTMQQLKLFSRTPLLALVPVVIVEVTIIAVFALCTAAREQVRMQAERAMRGVKQVDMWSDEVFDAEIDISSLSLSFLIVQVLRFSMTGVLPHQDGTEVPEEPHSVSHIFLLYAFGVAFLVVALLLIRRQAQATEGNEESMQSRIHLVSLNSAAMAFAWCVVWATRWACVKLPMIDVASILGRVVMALMLSGAACAAVFVLDRVSDMYEGSRNSRSRAKAVTTLVRALGILIGFSWEHAFHGGTEAFASLSTESRYREVVNLGIGFILVLTLMPLWRRHILTKEIALQQIKDERDEAAVAKTSQTWQPCFPAADMQQRGQLALPRDMTLRQMHGERNLAVVARTKQLEERGLLSQCAGTDLLCNPNRGGNGL